MEIIETLQAEAAKLEEDIAQLRIKQKRLAAIHQAIKAYSEDRQPAEYSKRFSTIGTTEAVLQFLAERAPEALTPAEVAKGIQSGGHSTASDHLLSIVYVVCKRKAAAGKLEVTKTNGHQVFKIANS